MSTTGLGTVLVITPCGIASLTILSANHSLATALVNVLVFSSAAVLAVALASGPATLIALGLATLG